MRGAVGGDDVLVPQLSELVARGNSVIAEIYRLADFVPADFANPPSTSKLKDVLIDFHYFEIKSAFETRIENDENLRLLDDQLYHQYAPILQRFHALFSAIGDYVADFTRFADEFRVGDDAFGNQYETIQQRQLLVEALYLCGLIFLVLEHKLPGGTRERLFIAHHRTNAQRASTVGQLTLTVDLIRNCPGGTEQLLRRIKLNPSFVEVVVARLRCDDLYNESSAIGLSDFDRSAQLAPQAAMLYVCLYFSPHILHTQTSIMRELVDKFFVDNWVLSLHMGVIVNLLDAWEPFKAAHGVISQTVATCLATGLARARGATTRDQVAALENHSALAHIATTITQLRGVNRLLRWLLLHTFCGANYGRKALQIAQSVQSASEFLPSALFALLLRIANFELKFKQVPSLTVYDCSRFERYRKLLAAKPDKCNAMKRDISEHLFQLAHLFLDDQPLRRIRKNVKLHDWLLLVKEKVEAIDVDEHDAHRTIAHLRERINEVSEVHDFEGNVTVRQYIAELSSLLGDFVHIAMLREETLLRLEATTEMGYAWTLVDQWTHEMREEVERCPEAVRAVFVKLSGAIAQRLLRIANNEQLTAVSMCYSRQLETRLRHVLQAVPHSLFALLDAIRGMEGGGQIASRIEKTAVRHVADLDRRFQIAEKTFAISTLAEGIAGMKLTWLGSVRIDPRRVLDDGLRRELVSHYTHILHHGLQFPPRSMLQHQLDTLALEIGGLRSTFVYMTEHVAVNGAAMWQHEIARVLGYMLEQECNVHLAHKIGEDESLFQSRLIPLPRLDPIDSCPTALGRLLQQIRIETDPKTSYFVRSLFTWYDARTKKQRVTRQLFKSIQAAISPIGMWGVDRCCAFTIVEHLQRWFVDFRRSFEKAEMLETMLQVERDCANTLEMPNPSKSFDSLMIKTAPHAQHFINLLCKIGQLQLIRMAAQHQIENCVRFESAQLANALTVLNQSVLNDIRQQPASPDNNAFLYELSQLLEHCAFTDPLVKVYIRVETPVNIISGLVFIVLNSLPKLSYIDGLGVVGKRGDGLDAGPLIVGVLCVLRQLPTSAILDFLRLCCGFVQGGLAQSVRSSKSAKQPPAIPSNASTMISLMSLLLQYADIPKSTIEKWIPSIG